MSLHNEILVVTCEHPDERPADEPADKLFRLLFDNPQEGVDATIGNTAAYAIGLERPGRPPRFVEENFVNVKPDPTGTPEQVRKQQLSNQISQYKLALSIHGTEQVGGEYVVCHPDATQAVWKTIALLGIRRVVHFTKLRHNLANVHRNYLLVDIPTVSPRTAQVMHNILPDIIKCINDTDSVQPEQFERYQYVGFIPPEKAYDLRLPDEMKAFDVYSPHVAYGLGYPDKQLYALTGSMDYAKRVESYGELAERYGPYKFDINTYVA